MGESRYFTAYGAQPFGERRAQFGAAQDRYAPDLPANSAWPDQAWPDQPWPDPSWPEEPVLHAAPSARRPYAGAHTASPPLTASAQAPLWPGQPVSGARHEGASHPYAPRPAAPVTLAGVAQGLGAVMSLVLLVGATLWTWQMMQRDVSGVPVVRALEGPLRVAPQDPGGMQAAYQGLSVNELASDGVSGLPDEIVLAPPPLDLLDERSAPASGVPGELADDLLIDVAMSSPAEQGAANIGADAAPLGFVSPNRFAVSRSPRPAARNAAPTPQRAPQAAPAPDASADIALAAAVANSVASDLARAGSVDVDPASIGPGTRLVQLGAYDSPAEARSAWDGLAQRFKPLLDDRGRVIEAAHSGGSVFYRLRAHGFNDERDARRFCAALIDQRLDCIPVLIR